MRTRQIHFFVLLVVVIMTLICPTLVSAHILVTPDQVAVGKVITFSVSVASERASAVTSLKLLLPSGLSDVTPTFKPGWTVTTTKSSGSHPTLDSITWSGGTIPAGLRDDFTFSAVAPATQTTLDWKAYQTYEDGTLVHWDQSPSTVPGESTTSGPFSVTKVTNDLSPNQPLVLSDTHASSLPLILSCLALIVSVAGLLFKRRG